MCTLLTLAFMTHATAVARAAETAPDLTTPNRALHAFIDAARTGDFAGAALALELRDEPAVRAAGPKLARQLKFVLDQKLWIDWESVSDEPGGNPADGLDADTIGAIGVDGGVVPVRLTRARDGSWRIGQGVVSATPRLYAAYGPGWLGERLPPALIEVRFLDVQAWQWIGIAAALLLATFVAGILGAGARRFALRAVRRTRFTWDDRLVEAASGPGRLLLGVATFATAIPTLHLAVPAAAVASHALRISGIAVLCWAGLRALRFGSEVVEDRLSRAAGDDASARTRRTQVMVLKRVAGFVLIALASALVLLQFDAMRAVGTSLLASAGVAGLVVGLAAQRSIATLLAGLQLSLTQPLRVGDVVVIEGEWGTIEEITLTYLVVKIWDQRRLVVPITKVLEASFQNWTRSGADILGTVFVHADYRAPVDLVRRELERFVAGRREWDRRVVGLQVTSATDRTIELRALLSSADASQSWDLRCAVREHLVSYLQQLEHGRFLPRTRVEPSGPVEPRNDVAGLGAGVPTCART